MKLQISDLTTERQWRAAIGADQARFAKLLGEAIKLLGITQQEQIPLAEDLGTSGGRWSLTHG